MKRRLALRLFLKRKQARSLGGRGIRPRIGVIRVRQVAGEPGVDGIRGIMEKKKKKSNHFHLRPLLIHHQRRFLPQRPRDQCPSLRTGQKGATRVVLAVKQLILHQLRALPWEQPTLPFQRLGHGIRNTSASPTKGVPEPKPVPKARSSSFGAKAKVPVTTPVKAQVAAAKTTKMPPARLVATGVVPLSNWC